MREQLEMFFHSLVFDRHTEKKTLFLLEESSGICHGGFSEMGELGIVSSDFGHFSLSPIFVDEINLNPPA